mgnify:FL=1
MSRYDNTKIKIKDLKQGYLTTLYDRVPFSNSDLYVISQEGDRLDTLANQFYGDSTLWWYIANANNLNKINLEPGTSLRIPANLEAAKGS